MPFAQRLGVEVESATAQEVRGSLDWAADLCTAGGLCAYLNLPEGASGTATIESKTNFFRPVREGRIVALARPLHVGRTFVVVQTNLSDAAEKPVAQVTQTQAVLA